MQRGENLFVAGAEGGDEPGGERAQCDDADGKCGHDPVDVDGVDAGHVVTCAQKPLERGGGENEAELRRRRPRAGSDSMRRSRTRRNQPPPSAVRMASSLRRGGGARDQQIGDVEAGDKQHAAGGGQQHQERTAEIADHVIEQRADVGVGHDEGVVAMGIVETERDQGQIGARLLRRVRQA